MSTHLSVHIDSLRYPGERTDLIRDLRLEVPSGAFVSLLGPSGIGKTTFLRVIAGLERRYRGSVDLDGRPVRRPSRDIQILFQDSRLLPWMTAAENVRFAVPPNASSAAATVVERWLKAVRLDGKARSWTRMLSGGEASRVALARAFAGDPEVLLLDEPFANLDVKVRYDLHVELQKALLASPKTVLQVTHTLEDALLLSDTVYLATSLPMGQLDEFPISIPRPRRPSDNRVAELATTIVARMLGSMDRKELKS